MVLCTNCDIEFIFQGLPIVILDCTAQSVTAFLKLFSGAVMLTYGSIRKNQNFENFFFASIIVLRVLDARRYRKKSI